MAAVAVVGWWVVTGDRTTANPPTGGGSPAHSQARYPPLKKPLAQCNDGTLSYAANHQGACSWHGGVAVWYR
jgi:hypothetical protein